MKVNPRQFRLLSEHVGNQTISTQKNNPYMKQGLMWLKTFMKQSGFNQVKTLSAGKDYPGLLGTIKTNPEFPTILLYGHFDVQPPGDESAWDSPPFKLTQKGDFLYGRGVSDNKGQHFTVLLALEELLTNRDKLKWNVKIFLEANEETGGKGLKFTLTHYHKHLDADIIVGVDGEMPKRNQPVIYYSGKGLIYYKITVYGANREFHSGYYGGIVQDPSIVLSKFLASLTDDSGKIAVTSVYDQVRPPTKKEIDNYKNLNIKLSDIIKPEDKAPVLGKTDFNLIFNNAFEPTLTIHAINVGDVNQLKTAIASKASATFSIRTVPDQSNPVLDKAVNKHASSFFKRFGTRFKLKTIEAIDYAFTNPDTKSAGLVAKALESACGKRTVFKRFSAGMPIFSLINKTLRKPFILTGFGLPEGNIHAANERLYIPNFLAAQKFTKHLLTTIYLTS